MITIRPAAAAQIQGQLEQDDGGNLSLRLAAKQDDSGAFEYGMGFDEAGENDLAFDCDGIKVIISPDNEETLKGTSIDYVEIEPGKFHFIFLNPNDPNFVPPTDD